MSDELPIVAKLELNALELGILTGALQDRKDEPGIAKLYAKLWELAKPFYGEVFEVKGTP